MILVTEVHQWFQFAWDIRMKLSGEKIWLFRERVEYQKSTNPYIRYAPG